MSSSEESAGPRPLAGWLAAMASGAVATAAIATVEILSRLSSNPPLLSPLRDLSSICWVGAVCGLVIGVLRTVPMLRSLSAFGVVLGAGVGAQLWLRQISGGALVGDALVRLAISGALHLLIGAGIGHAVGLVMNRLLPRRGHALRDLLVTAALLAPATIPTNPSGLGTERPNLLLLTVDTLRQDRLGFMGHPVPTSPALDRLARRSDTMLRAVTPLPRTLPAVASIMTGAHPQTHGVRDNFHYTLGPNARTLAETLRDAGWSTAAVNSNPVLSHDSGVYQGFESASDRGDDWSRLALVRGVQRLGTLWAMRRGDRAQIITGLALDWLERRPANRPFFLWVHWLAPHMPYEPVAPLDERFAPTSRAEYRSVFDYGEISKGDMTYRNPLSTEIREHAKRLYDGEVATADRALQRLLREMEAAGALENTAILFTSDHGESLDEHGYFFNHGDFVYGPAANVPMIWRAPSDDKPTLREEPASLVDCLSLFTGIAGVDPPAGIDGRLPDAPVRTLHGESGFCRFPHLNDRLGWLLPREIAQSPDQVVDWREHWEQQANRAKQRFVEADGFKLVHSPGRESDRLELFELASDPGETRDLSPDDPARVKALTDSLNAWIERGRHRESVAEDRTLDDATREQMDALGYIGD